MGHNDHIDDRDFDLPPEAYVAGAKPIQLDDKWLEHADESDQVDAMRQWFYARYESPWNQTPYDNEDGEFIWVYGGPYNTT